MARRTPGRIIDTHVFTRDGITIKTPIKMVRDRDEVTFTAYLENESSPLRNADMIALIKQLEIELVKRMDVKYETFLEISVEKESISTREDSESQSVRFSYGFLVIGTRKDGTKFNVSVSCHAVSKDGEWNGRREGLRFNDGVPEVGINKHRWHGERTMVSLVPATRENIAAVKEFLKSMDMLWDKMSKFFSPKLVEQNLKRIPRLMLTGGA